MIKSIIFIGFFFLSIPLMAQLAHQDKIVDVVEKAKEGKQVYVKGEVTTSSEKGIITVGDGTADIQVKLNLEGDDKTIPSKGDIVSVDGIVTVDSRKGKYIRSSYVRKHKYVKDPAHCCRPELP